MTIPIHRRLRIRRKDQAPYRLHRSWRGSRDLSMGQRPQLAHLGNQGGGSDHTDTRNRCENGTRGGHGGGFRDPAPSRRVQRIDLIIFAMKVAAKSCDKQSQHHQACAMH